MVRKTRKRLFLAVGFASIGCLFWIFKPLPLVSSGFPRTLELAVYAKQEIDIEQHAPNIVYFCIVGGYWNVNSFLKSKGMKGNIDLDVGESDFALLLESKDQKVDYALFRYDYETNIVSKTEGCFPAASNHIKFERSKSDQANTRAILTVSAK